MRRLSPIEMMVDKATGFKSGAPPPGWVTLRCPKCRRTKRVASVKSDPKNTATVEAPCNKCDTGGDKPETMYFDAQDRQIHPRTSKPFKSNR